MTNKRQTAIELLNKRIMALLIDIQAIHVDAKQLLDSEEQDKERNDHVLRHLEDVVLELDNAQECFEGAAASANGAVTGEPFDEDEILIVSGR